MTNLIKVNDWYQIADILGGDVSGDYKKDHQILNKCGYTCDENIYNQVHQIFGEEGLIE
jgi:hypothetical protein